MNTFDGLGTELLVESPTASPLRGVHGLNISITIWKLTKERAYNQNT